MKKGIRLVFVFVLLMTLLCSAAMAENWSVSEGVRLKGATVRENYVDPPLLCRGVEGNVPGLEGEESQECGGKGHFKRDSVHICRR